MRIILFLCLILFLLVLFFISSQILSRRSKLVIAVLLSVLIGGVYFYVDSDEKINSQKMAIVTEFDSGKALKCGDKDVNSTAYNYQYGTSTFIPKNPKSGLTNVQIKECM